MSESRTIVIPGCAEHAGLFSVHLTVPWVCMHCGGPRGEPYKGLSYDGSRRLAVDCWKNPCGHSETYAELRKHAAGQPLEWRPGRG